MTTSIEQEKIADKREAILETTLRLLSERGFHNTPMSLIAEEAGVAAGTIYRYFDNKETLINELFLELKRKFMQHLSVGLDFDGPTEELYRTMWRNTIQYLINHGDEMRFVEQHHNSPFQSAEVKAAVDELNAPFKAMFEAAIAAGELKDMPYEMIYIYSYEVAVAFAKRHLNGKLVMDEDLLEQAIQISWDVVKGR